MDATFDYNLRLKDAGAITASAAAQVGGSDKILDMGASRFDGRVIIDTTAIEVDTGNELYQVVVQGSTSPTFASGIVTLGEQRFGDSSVTLEDVDSVEAQRREIAFTNEVNGTVYRYVRVYTIIAGTIATGINYTANLVKAA
jgi:hypothetical protein